MSLESATQLAFERLSATSIGRRCLEGSTEIVVFGSVSVGLERADSDIDILCIADFDCRSKTKQLDLNVMQIGKVNDANWLGSELASHIAEYGIWIRGAPKWTTNISIGDAAIESKRRRLNAFMRALPSPWFRWDQSYQMKYATKLRRETQRLLLLEQGISIPPTKMLDSLWSKYSRSANEVQDRLRQFSISPTDRFTRDVCARIGAAIS